MGETIRKAAAANDIISDTKEAYNRAQAKQGKWQELAEERLGPVIKLVVSFTTQLEDAEEIATPLIIALDVEDERADLVIGKASDGIWNAVGRPASDPALAILFPGGNAFYVDGDVTEQPDRMELLIQLLKAGVHPKLPADIAAATAAELKTAADALRVAAEAARGPRTKVLLLQRIKAAIARSAAIELAGFKRVLKAHGFTEAEIHTVIPDRSRPAPKKPDPEEE